MSSVIILIDGAFFTKKFKTEFKKFPCSKDVKFFTEKMVELTCPHYELLRIYYYDCPPMDVTITNPISHNKEDLSKTKRYKENNKLLDELKRTDFFSVREGFLSNDGWMVKNHVIKNKRENDQSIILRDSDLKANITQKGVDMKIGLDIAWISLEKVSQRIILVTGDSDFIPAIKFARRCGIQVFLATLNHGVSKELLDHADCLITTPIKLLLKNNK